jgi:tetraprenyl-beta-curcumene synthase
MPAATATATQTKTATLGGRWFVARTGMALVLANLRYWTSVAPTVRDERRRWESRARAIEDPELRALALGKLEGEGLHAEAAAMLATKAPRAHRADVVRAIVALELLYDYLDGLTERPCGDPLGEGERLFAAYTDALAGDGGSGEEKVGGERADGGHREAAQPENRRWEEDGGYLRALSDTVGAAFARLPARASVVEVARRTAARGAGAQIRMHAAPRLGRAQVEQWAKGEADGTDLGWRELLAGSASSVLTLHALIAAAADARTTDGEAVEIESAYLQTCVLVTLLDGLVDHEQDGLDSLGYIDFYEDGGELCETLEDATRRAATRLRALRGGGHHAMTLVGVVAYYTSDPGAEGERARMVVGRLQRQLAPLMGPTLTLMRVWRRMKRGREKNRRAGRGGGLASYSETRAEVEMYEI